MNLDGFNFSYFLVAAFTFSTVISADVDIEPDYDGSGEAGRHDWDVLILTQQWPVTTCYHWREEDEKRACNLPQKESWTIHGVWPTAYGKVGPNFCNKSAHFDIAQLESIMDDLRAYWPQVELSGTDITGLWKHEWMKHGTCAMILPELSDEKKYFGQGLQWRSKYLISDILGSSGIHPDSSNTVTNIQSALKRVLGKNPSIHCIYDRKKDASFLSEIRICFNKTLELIDCDGVLCGQVAIDYPGGKVITNCHISKPVQYPSIMPPLKKDSWQFPFVNVYKLLNFIMWFTL